MTIAFYLLAAIAVVTTILVITHRNVVHALLYFIVSLLSVAVMFFIIGAPFVAALEVIIYAGAIMVLFLFVVMMFSLGVESVEQERRWTRLYVWIIPG
ncbi:MAG TPA: NADH-quinone oxidoreductase subunit J, partial [Opitutaceae bacterium]